MRLTLRLISFGIFCFTLSGLHTGVRAGESVSCGPNDGAPLEIAVIARRGTLSGSVEQGVRGACKATASTSATESTSSTETTPKTESTPTQVSFLPYDDERDGFDKIRQLITEKSVQLIIGPTESSLFLRLDEFLDTPERQVPIVSPIVTADVEKPELSWLFRINVNTARRARAIYSFLNKRDVQNFAVLYADNKFGETAEAAFRGELFASQNMRFRSFRYSDPDVDVSDWLRQTYALRPEAIGIFGSRDDIRKIRRKIPSNEWNAYDPYVFTIVDMQGTDAENMYFLTVGSELTEDGEQTGNEVAALSFDTTVLLLKIAEELQREGIAPGKTEWPEQFKTRLMNKMSQSMSDDRLRTSVLRSNNPEPTVMRFDGPDAKVVALRKLSGWESGIVNWFEILGRRFGVAPIVNLAGIGLIVVFLTGLDLRRTQGVLTKELREVSFVMLMLFNATVAMALFFVLAMQDVLAWDSVAQALIVAFGYAGLLNSTLFQTDAGEAIGARRYYERMVGSIHDNIRKRQFEKRGPIINYIAYANSRSHLREMLVDSYSYAGEARRKEELIAELEAEVEKGQSTISKRKALARKALSELTFASMVAQRIVPANVKREKIPDPEPIVARRVDLCMAEGTPTVAQAIRRVEGLHTSEELRREFRSELELGLTPKAELSVCFRWMILLEGYSALQFLNSTRPLNWDDAETSAKSANDSAEPANRRECPRAALAESLTVVGEGKAILARFSDISESGAKIVFAEPQSDLPDNLTLSTTAKAKVPIENATVEVIHHELEEDSVGGCGVRWCELEDETVSCIRDYVVANL